jgi:Na+/phosphate symporter
MIIATIPALVMVAGALMYALAANPKLAELGRIMFAMGLLVVLLALQGAGSVRVLP